MDSFPFSEDDVLGMEVAESSDGRILRFTLFIRNPEYMEGADPAEVESELQAIINQTKGQ